MALPAAAQARKVKISTDLRLSVSGAAGAGTRWIKTPDGRPVVKVLIAVNSSDASLRSLRAALLAHGGSVHCVYLSMRGLAGLVPASALESAGPAQRCRLHRPQPGHGAHRQPAAGRVRQRGGAGRVLSEGLIPGEGFILSESSADPAAAAAGTLAGDP